MSHTYDLAIVGMGPAGLGLAESLLHTETIKNTICFERGFDLGRGYCANVNNGNCCQSEACHVVSGISGSSNLSSGKISCFPAGSGLVDFFESEQHLKNVMLDIVKNYMRDVNLKKVDINDTLVCEVERQYKLSGIEFKYYDVYEFEDDNYRQFFLKRIQKLVDAGLCIQTNTEVVDIYFEKSTRDYIITVNNNAVLHQYKARNVVIAIGANEIQENLLQQIDNDIRVDYEIGVRVEAEAECFGEALNTHGDLKLKYDLGRTYCVTKQGAIVSYRSRGLHFLEGYVEAKNQTRYSNLAVLIKQNGSINLSEILCCYREKFRGEPVKQRYVDFLNNVISSSAPSTTLASAKNGNINEIFPASVNQFIRDFIEHVLIEAMHMDRDKLTLVAPELKLLNSITLSKQFELAPNLYVIGAATGKFRGILQSFCSGLKCGQNILRR